MSGILRRTMYALLLALIAGPFSCAAPTPAYPQRPITLVNPYAAGGPADVLARRLAKELGAELGQPVIVENKPGAAAALGTAYVARAKPDGYTLLIGTSAGHVVTPLLHSVTYDGVGDFSFIGIVASQSNMLVINPQFKVNNVAELIAYARQHPGQLNFGSAGTGGATHLGGELFMQKAGINIVHIPYNGAALALTDLIGGQVQMAFLNLSACLPHIKDGRIKALAYASAHRSRLLPQVPTLEESGIHGADVPTWYSLAAPKGTPSQILDRLNAALQALNARREYAAFMESLDADLLSLSPAQTTEFVEHDRDSMAKLLRSIGLAK
ncbi:Bug family tripartite tricarboxylate transporter substrate binding protein [Candidimonas humi]|uniref:Bug family tripartite tricarboxylate transporter substrate binding protein n=1 Tax=Candidimonas humi TaxID=683355 RepID=A0ABV8NX64_9BURK|nr:tripartite tricarboxylate transporter substrate binding protein [Candidimonas humi]